jgi:cobalamin biosynthesis protein CobD/CbiB
MEIQNASEILLIIVSSVLSIFLIVAIILGIYLIKLSAEIRHLAKTAQNTVDHIDTAVTGVSRLISPMFVANMIGKYIKKFTKKGKK